MWHASCCFIFTIYLWKTNRIIATAHQNRIGERARALENSGARKQKYICFFVFCFHHFDVVFFLRAVRKSIHLLCARMIHVLPPPEKRKKKKRQIETTTINNVRIDSVLGDMTRLIQKDVSKRYHFFVRSFVCSFFLCCLCVWQQRLMVALGLVLLLFICFFWFLLHSLFILSFRCVCYLFDSTTHCVVVCWPRIKHAFIAPNHAYCIELNVVLCYVWCGVCVCNVCDCAELVPPQRTHTHNGLCAGALLLLLCLCVLNNLLLHLLKYWCT